MFEGRLKALMWACLIPFKLDICVADENSAPRRNMTHIKNTKAWSVPETLIPHLDLSDKPQKGPGLAGTAAIVYQPTKVGYMENREGLLAHLHAAGGIRSRRPASVHLLRLWSTRSITMRGGINR